MFYYYDVFSSNFVESEMVIKYQLNCDYDFGRKGFQEERKYVAYLVLIEMSMSTKFSEKS